MVLRGACERREAAAAGKFSSRRDAANTRYAADGARMCPAPGVPDSYVIDVPLNQALFGFGDAVCVPAVEWIAETYLRPLVRQIPPPYCVNGNV